MIPSKEELEITKQFAKRKMKDIATKKGKDLSTTDLLDLCTLNSIEDSAKEQLGEFDD